MARVVVASGVIGYVAEVALEVGEGFDYVAEAVVEAGEEFGCMTEVVVEDLCWVDDVFGRAVVLASALPGEGCQRCTVPPRALLALY
jgi:hypothetical protein